MSDMPVFVALSGGVDSAVAATLLKEKHDTVIGISHRHWPESRCCSTECIDRCAEQCDTMGIPYYPVDCMVEFATQIVDNFVERYESGVTPNPCVLCNENIRFGLMVDKHFQLQGADSTPPYKLATGHYARVEQRGDRYHLMRGVDHTKDQSYMLYRLSQDELSHCIFPLGSKEKSEVRALAEKFELKSAKVGDSMDICFVQDTYQEFLKQYSDKVYATGDFVDPDGNVLGQHKGLAFYTRGQRSGLGLNNGPWFITRLDPAENIIHVGPREDLAITAFDVFSTRWIYPPPTESFECTVMTRYRSREIPATVTPTAEGASVKLTDKSVDVTPGQSAVFYNGDDVIGGGIIR